MYDVQDIVYGLLPVMMVVTFSVVFIIVGFSFKSLVIPLRAVITIAFTLIIVFGAVCPFSFSPLPLLFLLLSLPSPLPSRNLASCMLNSAELVLLRATFYCAGGLGVPARRAELDWARLLPYNL